MIHQKVQDSFEVIDRKIKSANFSLFFSLSLSLSRSLSLSFEFILVRSGVNEQSLRIQYYHRHRWRSKSSRIVPCRCFCFSSVWHFLFQWHLHKEKKKCMYKSEVEIWNVLFKFWIESFFQKWRWNFLFNYDIYMKIITIRRHVKIL